MDETAWRMQSALRRRTLAHPGAGLAVVRAAGSQQQFAEIPMLLVQGSSDQNDSVPEGIEVQSRENFASDSYSFEQSKWVNEYFGTLPIDRLPLVREVYQSLAPVDFAYASLLNEKHSDKNIKPMAVRFFTCVISANSHFAAKIKARIEDSQTE